MTNGKNSLPSKVVSGVPLLFIILMGDIDKGVRHSVTSLFADDTNISKTVSTVGDINQLQQDLGQIQDVFQKLKV